MKNLILTSLLLLLLSSISFSVAAQPLNDNCSGAVQVLHSQEPVWTTANTATATQSAPACGTNQYSDDDVWFSFVATDTIAYLKFRNTDYIGGNYNNVAFELFSGSCGNLTSVLCSNEKNPRINYPDRISGIVPGQIYYLRVYSIAQSVSMTFDFCVLTHQLYDRCATAPSLTMSQDMLIDSVSFASTLYVVNTGNPWVNYPWSTTGGDDDIWLRFTASDTAHTVWIDPTEYRCPGCVYPYTFYHAVYGGICGQLDTVFPTTMVFPNFAADSAFYIDIGGLLAGNEYFLRLWTPKTNGSPVDIYAGIGPLGSTGQMPFPASVNNLISEDPELAIVPNPAAVQLNIRLTTTTGDGTISIFDVTGKELYQHPFKGDLLLDVGDYAPGVYFVRYSGSVGVTTGKFIKQ